MTAGVAQWRAKEPRATAVTSFPTLPNWLRASHTKPTFVRYRQQLRTAAAVYTHVCPAAHARAAPRRCSSAGESARLIIVRSSVQVRPSLPRSGHGFLLSRVLFHEPEQCVANREQRRRSRLTAPVASVRATMPDGWRVPVKHGLPCPVQAAEPQHSCSNQLTGALFDAGRLANVVQARRNPLSWMKS